MPCSKVPVGGDPKQVGRPGAVARPSTSVSCAGVHDVGQALDAVGVGVQRGREPAVRGAEVAQQERGRLVGDPPRQRVAGQPPQLRVDPQQQRVVVEHLLEVRHGPRRVHRVPGEPAGQLVVHAAAGHPLARCAARSPAPRPTPVRWWWRSRNSRAMCGGNFGRAAEPAVRRVVARRRASAAAASSRPRPRSARPDRRPAATPPIASTTARALLADRVALVPPRLGRPTRAAGRTGRPGSRCRRRTARRRGWRTPSSASRPGRSSPGWRSCRRRRRRAAPRGPP